MMGVSEVFIFALLFILYTGGNSEDRSNITDSSNHHRHLHPRAIIKSFFSRAKAEKEEKVEDQSVFDFDHNLEFVVSKDPPEDAVLVPYNNEKFYILGLGKCNEEKLGKLKSTDISSPNTVERGFLVNKEDFEILEWKKWADIESDKIPFRPIMICKSKCIAKDNNGITFMAKDSLKKKKNKQTEVLTVNHDIKDQYFQIDNFAEQEDKKPDKLEVIKRVRADNRNCEKAKHVVKFDHGSDKTTSFIKSRTHTVGGGLEISMSGKIPALFDLTGKLSGKYDYSHLNSETTSNLDKVLHSVSIEIEVAPNYSCTIDILSKTSTAEVQCSGRLIRQYNNNNEVHTTSVNGIYNHQEVAELQSSVNSCKPLSDGPKCGKA